MYIRIRTCVCIKNLHVYINVNSIHKINLNIFKKIHYFIAVTFVTE